MSSRKRIAVVILNWNGSNMMRQFLPSVIKGSGEDGEVIVADNGSTDDSCEMLSREFPNLRQIRLSENYGFAEGYNQALKQVDAEFYLLLNSDVEVSQDWLKPLLSYMDAHQDVAACQPKILSYKERDKFEYAGAAGGFLDIYGYPYCRGRVFADVEQDYGQYDDTVDVLWATGAALMVRREDWHDTGGLDGRFFAHQEEIDLCWRLRRRGRRVVCIPQSKVWHVGGASLEQGNPRKTFLNFRNNLAMLYKNLPEADLHRVMRLRFWLDYLAALQFALKGDLANAKAVRRGRRAFKQWRNELKEERQRLMQESSNNNVAEIAPYALLWQYYAKGRKVFSKLPKLQRQK